jgi:hypothetical protein
MSVRDVRQGGRPVDLPASARSGPSLTPLGAIVLIVALAALGAVFDVLTGTGLRWGFAVTLIAGSLVAAVLVRKHAMLYVVLAPPLIYLVASVIVQAASPGGLASTGGMIDFLTGLLAFGFPAIAGATGGAAAIAGIRLAATGRR